MSELAKIRVRPSTTRNAVVQALRKRIVQGVWTPGTRLPIRSELETQLKVSRVTLQKALDYLARDGFVQARGKLGTFVTDRPPHLTNCALIFPFRPGMSAWTRFWTAMNHEVVGMAAAAGRRIPTYYNMIDGRREEGNYQQLVRDVQEHRLAGLMFASSPHLVENTPLMTEPGIPRVAAMSMPGRFPSLWTVSVDGGSFVHKSLDYLAERGRKRIAVLRTPGLVPQPGRADNYLAALAARGMTTCEHWQQYVWEGSPLCARNVVSLLMQAGGERPDGLVIADDNLVEHAVAGLMMAGVKVGVDVDVVAHTNFPLPSPSGLPVRRLGFDVRHVLARCLEAIDRQRAGETEQQMLRVAALWEEEVAPSERVSAEE